MYQNGSWNCPCGAMDHYSCICSTVTATENLQPEPSTFQPGDQVEITYPNSITAARTAEVVADDGGPKVLVKWQAYRKIRSSGGNLRSNFAGTGRWHEQRIPRERLISQQRWRSQR